MKRSQLLYCIMLAVFCTSEVVAADTIYVSSPDGRISFKLFTKGEQMQFSIAFNGSTVLAPSPLLLMINGKRATSNIKFLSTRNFKSDGSYPVLGVHAVAVDRSNGLRIKFRSAQYRGTFEIRVFNDGAAFRQAVEGKRMTLVPEELTALNLPSGSMVWYHDLDMHYEGVLVKS